MFGFRAFPRYSYLLLIYLLVPIILFSFARSGHAEKVGDVLKANESINRASKASQKKINKIVTQTESLLDQYKQVSKQVDGLKTYNKQLNRQLTTQQKEMAKIKQSISDVTVVERQVMPLILKMVEGLELFVGLDMPFLAQERKDRIESLKAFIDRTDVSMAGKYRRTLEAFQVENEYGRTIESYRDTIKISGSPREVSILRIGRISLLFQTLDGTLSGAWNQNDNTWDILEDPRMNTYIRRGLKMASNQTAPDIMLLPIKVKD